MTKSFASLMVILFISISHVGIAEEIQNNSDDLYLSFYKKTVSRLLPNYRLPQERDYKTYWKHKNSYIYKTKDDEGKYKAPYWTKGFFNEDGKIDYAYILIKKNDGKKYLYAILSRKENYVAKLLDDNFEIEMGVATQLKGWVVTVSGKGYREPSKDDPPKVYVKNNAIAFFHFEGAGSIFLWNEKDDAFKKYWTSD